jgi:hypothetical protein
MIKVTEPNIGPVDRRSDSLGMVRAAYSVIRHSEFERIRIGCITELAFAYWLLRGCPQGSPELDWLKAETEVDQELLEELDLSIPA